MSGIVPSLQTLRAVGFLSALDEHFARVVGSLARDERPEVQLAAALVSRQVGEGHVCLDLRRFVEDGPPLEEGVAWRELEWPEPHSWLDALRSSELVAQAGAAAELDLRPLVVDGQGRVYLRRYWDHQARLAEAIRSRCAAFDADVDGAALREGLDRFFPGSAVATGAAPDWQRLAALIATLRPFCVISGGPGTGKTYAVAKILALLVELALRRGQRAPRVKLVAPTGKAAARLAEVIGEAKAGLDCAAAVLAAIPDEAATIHRCLGTVRGSGTEFRHNAGNPLLADLVVVDEASMVDLALMARLADALPDGARLILLGDEDQLASVEAGAVLGDICNTGEERSYSLRFARAVAELTGDRLPCGGREVAETGIWDCIALLRRSYRYSADSGIGALARAINSGDARAALAALESDEYGEVSLCPLPTRGELGESLCAAVIRGFTPHRPGDDAPARLRELERFRVLCAHRRGRLGADAVNRQIEGALAGAGTIRPQEVFYNGRPIIVTRNDYQLELFNGDVGIIVDDRSARPVACFIAADGTPRFLSPSRLPPHETVFAMSVHKSQGSEFDEVAVVLPDAPSPVVSRALLYTAVTRARRKATIYATPRSIEQAVSGPIQRASGLRDALWG